jgi:hypothetical protein
MDPIVLEILAPAIGIGIVSISVGWVVTTWMRVKHGYPLDGAWGQAVYPKNDGEAKQRVTLLTQENAELRAELGSVKDRLANIERIVTDRGYHLGAEIDALRDSARERALSNLKDKGEA